MKVSVNNPEEDVAFLDAYAAAQGYPSRSAALHKAIRLLRTTGLAEAYAAAWDEWEADDAHTWDASVGDGIT